MSGCINANAIPADLTMKGEDPVIKRGTPGNVFETICQGYNVETSLKLTFSLDSLNEMPKTEKVLVADHLYWHLYVSRSPTNGVDYLTAYAYTDEMYKYPMAYDVKYTLEAKNAYCSITKHAKCAYDLPDYHFIGLDLIEYDRLLNRLDTFEVDGKLTVTAQINVRMPMCVNFYDENAHSDVRIKIYNVSFPLNKIVLAFHSPFFKAMFFGQFKESTQEEITLPDVDRVAFVKLINVLYVPPFELKLVDLAAVLELADRFAISTIVKYCENMLMNCDRGCSKPTLAERFALASRYSLVNLQERCLAVCDSVALTKEVMASPHYKDVSDTIKASLFERVMKFVPAECRCGL